MQIREVHIDGFGIFTNKHMRGLTQGINIIFGPNEFGKTTLLEFIRRILFGFPTRSTKNPYPAINGGTYGGKLTVEMDGGNILTIHRTRGPHGGPINILTEDSEFHGQTELENRIGIISKVFYENVYAISLDELQSINTLNEEEIKSRIYGAGLGIGSVSLPEIKKEITKHNELLFKPRGSVQQIPRIFTDIKASEKEIREIQIELGNYDGLIKERDNLVDEVNLSEAKIKVITSEIVFNENMQKLYPKYLELTNAKIRLLKLAEIPEIFLGAAEKLDDLHNELVGVEDSLEEKEADFKTLTKRLDLLDYKEKVLEHESEVISLQKLSGQYNSAIKENPVIGKEKAGMEKQVKTKTERLGSNWTLEKVKNFQLSHIQQETLRSLKRKLESTQRAVENEQSKLSLHQEQTAAKTSQGIKSPKYIRYSIYSLTIIGIIGFCSGLISVQWPLIGISSIITIIGLIVSILLFGGNQIKIVDPLEKRLTKSLEKASNENLRIKNDWQKFLEQIGFDSGLTVEGTIDIVNAIGDIQSDISSIEEKSDRIISMTHIIESVKKIHNQIFPHFSDSLVADNIATNIDIFTQQLNDAKEKKNKKDGLMEQINELQTRITANKKRQKKKKKEINRYLSSLGCKDEENLKQKHRILIERNDLSDTINNAEEVIQSSVGRGDDYVRFLDTISETNPQKIAVDLETLNNQLEENKESKSNNTVEIGKLDNKIEQLYSNDDLIEKQHELEVLKERLQEDAQEWAKSQIALRLLNEAISKYERTRQPAVVKEAEKIISDITGGLYPYIIQQAESGDLVLKDSDENIKKVAEMSRGTKEELYFAMRLGLIQEYEKRAESLPVVIDDTLVNFDDSRVRSTIKALDKFAKTRQVIVFTCHETIRNIFKEYRITEISVS